MGLSNRDKNLIEAFTHSCRLPEIPNTVQYIHMNTVYAINRWAYLIRPATEYDKSVMLPGQLYPVIPEKPIKPVRDITKCDPSVCQVPDGVEIHNLKEVLNTDLLFTKASTGGSQSSFLYFLEDKGDYKTVHTGVKIDGTALTVLPMRPYKFRPQTAVGNFDGCRIQLKVFLPLNAPIVVITGDVVVLNLMTNADFDDIRYKPVQINGIYYVLDGWRVSQTPGSSTYQYFKKLKGIKKMKLPSPIKREAPAAAPATQPPASVPLDEAAEEVVTAPVRPVARPKAMPKPAPAPKPAPVPEPQVEEFQEPVDIMDEAVEAGEAIAEAVAEAGEPMGETDRNGYTAPPASQLNTEPGPDAPAEKKRTRKAAPVVPVGFDFGPVLEYTGSALPEELTADQIEAEIRSLRDLVINASRRMCNLTFSMRKTGSANEAKLKAMMDLLGK